MRKLVLVLVLGVTLGLGLGPAAALSIPPLGEYPSDWSCDAQTRVCAGIAVGGTASCTLRANLTVSCTYSYGALARAWGPDGEAGTEVHRADALVRTCSSMRGCETLVEREFSGDCAWLPLLSCEDDQSVLDGAYTSHALALGECLTLSVLVQGAIAAEVHGPLAPAVIDEADASFGHADDAGSQVCHVDDGR